MDDGSKTLEQSIEMLKMAAAAGTTELVCTPHANRDYKFEPLVIRDRLKELEAWHRRRGAALHRVRFPSELREYSGCDYASAQVHHQSGPLLAGGVFGTCMIFRNTAEIFGRLQEAGMIPIITHPERNQLLQHADGGDRDVGGGGGLRAGDGAEPAGAFRKEGGGVCARRCSTGGWCISLRATGTI